MEESGPPITLASIWAQDRRGVLGDGKGMLWRVPADFAHFRKSTMGCPVLMGRTSFEALPSSLPGREIIVLSRRRDYAPEGVLVTDSLPEAIDLARTEASKMGAKVAWITGGASLYQQTMDVVEELVVTDLDFVVPENTAEGQLVYAPRIDSEVWRVDRARSDEAWREASGDGRWKVTTYVRR